MFKQLPPLRGQTPRPFNEEKSFANNDLPGAVDEAHTPRDEFEDVIQQRGSAGSASTVIPAPIPPAPVRILTCHCDASVAHNNHPTYRGIPKTMDITDVATQYTHLVHATTYSTFIDSIRDVIHNNFQWQHKATKRADAPMTTYIEGFSDYFINTHHFIDYFRQANNEYSHSKPVPESHKIRILIVPNSYTLSLTNGPYATFTTDTDEPIQHRPEQAEEAQPEHQDKSPPEKPCIPSNHIHNATPEAFANAVRHNWEHHFVVIYMKRRPEGQLYRLYDPNKQQPEQPVAEQAQPLESSAPMLKAKHLALIDAEMERCLAELTTIKCGL